MVQSVNCRILDLGSGHDLTAGEFKPRAGLCADSMGPAWDSLSLPLSAPPLLMFSLSLKLNKLKKGGADNRMGGGVESSILQYNLIALSPE